MAERKLEMVKLVKLGMSGGLEVRELTMNYNVPGSNAAGHLLVHVVPHPSLPQFPVISRM